MRFKIKGYKTVRLEDDPKEVALLYVPLPLKGENLCAFVFGGDSAEFCSVNPDKKLPYLTGIPDLNWQMIGENVEMIGEGRARGEGISISGISHEPEIFSLTDVDIFKNLGKPIKVGKKVDRDQTILMLRSGLAQYLDYCDNLYEEKREARFEDPIKTIKSGLLMTADQGRFTMSHLISLFCPDEVKINRVKELVDLLVDERKLIPIGEDSGSSYNLRSRSVFELAPEYVNS